MSQFETIAEITNINSDFVLRILKHLIMIMLLWSPIIYGVYIGFEFIVFSIIFLFIFFLFSTILIYQQKNGLKRIAQKDSIIIVEFYKYSTLKTEQFSIYNLEFEYSESGVYIPQGCIRIFKSGVLVCKQYSGLYWDNNKLKQVVEKIKIRKELLRFNEVNLKIDDE